MKSKITKKFKQIAAYLVTSQILTDTAPKKMLSLNNSFNVSKSSKSLKYDYSFARHKPVVQEQIDNFIRNKLQNEMISDSVCGQFINIVRQQLDKPTIIMAMHYADKLRDIKYCQTGEVIFGQLEELIVCAFVIADFVINDTPRIYTIIQQYNLDLNRLSGLIKYIVLAHQDCLLCNQDEYQLQKQEFEACCM